MYFFERTSGIKRIRCKQLNLIWPIIEGFLVLVFGVFQTWRLYFSKKPFGGPVVGSTHQDDDLKELSELMEMGKNKRVPRAA